MRNRPTALVDTMDKKLRTCAVLMFLAQASLGFGQIPPIAAPIMPEVTISVYDYAHIPSEFLAAAEGEAQRIFRQAGVETTWVTCLPKPERIDLTSCHSVDATHLTMKILPREMNAHVLDRSDVLGDALVDERGIGFFAYVFYDSVLRIAEEHRLGHALLGDVLAHETGHLLLRSKSHSVSGIMSAHWNGDELRRISEGTMFFATNQCRMLRDHVRSRETDSPNAERTERIGRN